MRSHDRFWTALAIVSALLLLSVPVGAAAEAPSTTPSSQIRHPNLLLNREEIEQIKGKIRAQPWAANLFRQVKGMADEMLTKGTRNEREAALCYVLPGDRRYADTVRHLTSRRRVWR